MDDKEYETSLMCDLIHPNKAKVLASYADEFYAVTTAITENDYGKGRLGTLEPSQVTKV